MKFSIYLNRRVFVMDKGEVNLAAFNKANHRKRFSKTILHLLKGYCNPALRKDAFSNILKILPPKTEGFQINILIFFHISALNIDFRYSLEPPRRGGSYEYPQSMFLSRKKKNNVYPVNPSFTI